MRPTLLGFTAVLCLSATYPCLAQDPVAVDPAHHKIEFENDQVRVLRIVFPPGSFRSCTSIRA